MVAGLIARLTGTPVVLALMAAMAVAGSAEVVAGRLALRRFDVVSIVTPQIVTVAAPAVLVVDVTGAGALRAGRLRVFAADSGHAIGAAPLGPGTGGSIVVDSCFDTPGIVTSITTTVEHAGPLGLLWWRRSATCDVDPVHVAPSSGGPDLDHRSSASTIDGSEPRAVGRHLGDVDGVRTWREGDPVGAIHWPSSLRSGDLIVHDRTATSDQRWEIDLDELAERTGDRHLLAAGLRHTLDEGLRLGHDVAVVLRGERHPVRSDDDAARWSAVVAHDPTERPASVPFWRRPLRLVYADETAAPIGSGARWAAAVASAASLLMLVGALSRSVVFVGVVVGGIALGGIVSLRIGARRPIALRVGIAAVIVAALALIAVDASGVGGLLEALRGPMPDLLVLLVVLHGFELVDRRTLRVHQAITFVVAAYAAGLRIDDALIWWIAAWAAALLVSIRLTAAAPGRPDPLAVTPPRMHGRVHGRAIGRSVVWLAACAIATLAVLSVVPIPAGPARLGLPAFSAGDTPVDTPGALAAPGGAVVEGDGDGDRGRIGAAVGYPGFTDTLDTTIRGDLGDEVVMRVRAPEPAFWRGQTFSDFDGRVWSASSETGRPQTGPTITVAPTLGDASADDVPTERFVQTYFVETDLPNVVFAASRPSEVVFDGTLWTRPDGALRSDVTLAPGSVYTVVSERAQVTADMLRAQGDLGEFFGQFSGQPGAEELDAFLEVPASTTTRTIDLATELRRATTYDTVLAYERWLGANTSYDLDAPVPAPGADAVDDFLFDSQRGYCEQIASTLAVMLRSQGVPARLAPATSPANVTASRGSGRCAPATPTRGSRCGSRPRDGRRSTPPPPSRSRATRRPAPSVGTCWSPLQSAVADHRLLVGGESQRSGRWRSPLPSCARARPSPTGPLGRAAGPFLAAAMANPGLPQDGPDRSATEPAAEPPILNGSASGWRLDVDVGRDFAEALDRAAFDPSWVDDDETYPRRRERPWRRSNATAADRVRRPAVTTYFVEMRALIAARRSANQGCWVLQSCGSSSRATAAGWSSTSAIAWIVRLVTIANSRGADAARAANSWAASRRESAGTER